MKRLLSTLLLAVVLSGCAVVSPIVRTALNEIGDALGVLSYGVASITVTPPAEGLHGLILDVQGVALTVEHDNCTVVELGHVRCNWGIVEEVITVPTTGINVTATSTYRLADSVQVHHEILSN